ncbi:MAG TPA: OmpH family outer membrane protein, partial [Elusimicrobiota bacterium]|nr:OmpH family outer membrane protein [Elusimicrobiota bacterium]
ALRTDIAKLNGERDLLLKTPIPAAEPPPDAARSTAPALGQLPEPTTAPLVINIPGLTNAPIVVQPPPASSVSAPPPPPPAPTAAELSARRDSRLKELDQALGEKIADLAKKEAGFKEYQAVTEKNLLELEGRRSEMLLGKIYAAVREVARENSVSVVVDKTQILFGQNSVDLTDKVLKKLSGEEKPKTTEPKP